MTRERGLLTQHLSLQISPPSSFVESQKWGFPAIPITICSREPSVSTTSNFTQKKVRLILVVTVAGLGAIPNISYHTNTTRNLQKLFVTPKKNTCPLKRERVVFQPAFLRGYVIDTLQGINISHLGKRKIIFKMPILGGYVSFLEGMLVQVQWGYNPYKCSFFIAGVITLPIGYLTSFISGDGAHLPEKISSTTPVIIYLLLTGFWQPPPRNISTRPPRIVCCLPEKNRSTTTTCPVQHLPSGKLT